MGEWLNYNSALIVLVLIAVMLAWFAWEHRRSWRALAVLAVIAVAVFGGYATSRHGPSDVATLAEVDALVGNGTPVVLEFLSDSCSICLASRRRVDAMEERLEGEAVVLQLNIADDAGRAAARRWSATATPTFIVFSAEGVQLHRESGFPDIDLIEATARAG